MIERVVNSSRHSARIDVWLSQLKDRPIVAFCTDDWGAYRRLMPDNKHLIRKDLTQNIERNNLNLRTHIKRLTRKRTKFIQPVVIK